jgi:hypothetical protein
MLAPVVTAPCDFRVMTRWSPSVSARAAPVCLVLIEAILGKCRISPSTAACMITGSTWWPAMLSTVDHSG